MVRIRIGRNVQRMGLGFEGDGYIGGRVVVEGVVYFAKLNWRCEPPPLSNVLSALVRTMSFVG